VPAKAVVIGGGTGAPVSIRALLALGVQTGVVVAMADDGGSSGMLREHTGTVPPGDVRKCLAAMAADPQSPWVRAFKYRFDYVNNHTLGNLILTALAANSASSFPQAVRLCEELLGARGHVYPSTLESVVLAGVTLDGRHLSGQATICAAQTALKTVTLTPAQPQPYQPALDALRAANLIVLGPGSLFTSIIPNLLVPGILNAIRESSATTVYLCNVADMQGETWGLNAAELVDALLDHGMRGRLDAVVVHRPAAAGTASGATAVFNAVDPLATPSSASTGGTSRIARGIRRVTYTPALARHIGQQGPLLIERDLVDPLRPTWHDVSALTEVLEGVLAACR